MSRHNAITRRRFLQVSSLAAAGFVVGCAANPVTGKNQLMLVSEGQEIDLDKKNAPHQFSADYGPVQDQQLNTYIGKTGLRLAALTHRPGMPYDFKVVNATYINAYAFPGGSIATTRGILLKLDNEAELAALLGHELGHVNARHTAGIMSKGMLTNVLVGGVAAVVGARTKYGDLAAQLGMLGSGALLASYSRDNERQADALGMEYMVKAGYGNAGMIGLMDMLANLSKHRQNATELLFSTHPMSSERYQNAVNTADTTYRAAKDLPLYKERYMDHTAGLRRMRNAIEALQNGEKALAAENYNEAETQFQFALKQAPSDYAALVMTAKCRLMQKKYDQADIYIEKARQVYPMEAQAHYIAGFIKIKEKAFDAALERFDAYDRQLPGNPNITFFRGYAHEGMQNRETAAENYYRFLQTVNQGQNARHAYTRLVEWGYIKPKK